MISYTTSFIPNRIMIIGCGGTGSRLVPLLGQFLKTCAWVLNPEITLIDDDVVEEKNLLRQNFIAPDVGKPKAEVLAQRYSRAFNVNILPRVARVTPFLDPYSKEYAANKTVEDAWAALFRTYTNNSIIILCVDSPEARRHILTRIMMGKANWPTHNMMLIDSGNENDFGQITISMGARCAVNYNYTQVLKDMPRSIPGDMAVPAIPMDLSYFRDMRAEDTVSCADLDQTMAINTMMAVSMFGVIQNLYYSKPISFYRMNVSLKDGNIPEYMTPAFIEKCNDVGNTVLHRKDFGANIDIGAPVVDFSTVVADTQRKVILPYQTMMKKHEADQKIAAEKAAVAEKTKIEQAAIKAAASYYGWSVPDNLKGEGPAAFLETKKKERTKAAEVLSPVKSKSSAASKALTQAEKEMEAFLALGGPGTKAATKRSKNLIEEAYGFKAEEEIE